MKIYNTNTDEYGCVIDAYDYLCDRGVPRSGSKWEIKMEMKIWNFIAKTVNKVSQRNTVKQKGNINI